MLASTEAVADALTAVDLFAGAGGLTVGLKAAGFRVVAAVELHDRAADVYEANHVGTKVIRRDVRKVSGQDLRDESPSGRIDLIAGCPPCQGFTSLTSKYRRDDERNALIEEMSRLVREVMPRAVMMENVPGLAGRGKARFDKFCAELTELGYKIDQRVLQVADYGTPQFRRRLVLLAGHQFDIPLPGATHSASGEDGKARWRSVKDAIGRLRAKPEVYSRAKGKVARSLADWHMVRQMTPENVARIKAAKPGESWKSIPEDLRPDCHKGGYSGFSNVYGRMTWQQVAPTITGGCTTLSKGRFGHPVEDRTISVREAALLQEFPSDYQLPIGFMEDACNAIGNALPCGFAQKMASAVKGALESSVQRA